MPRRRRQIRPRTLREHLDESLPWIFGIGLCAAPVLAWLWYTATVPADRRLNPDPTVQVIAGPRPESCGEMRETGERLGPVAAVLGRGDDTLMYRFRERRMATRYGVQTTLFDVPAGEVRIEPCGTRRAGSGPHPSDAPIPQPRP